jgi:hypothetical protein
MSLNLESSAITPDRVFNDPADQIRYLTEAPDSAVVNTKQASAFLGIAPETLEVWRSTRRQNLPYLKVGRSVRYLMGDLRKFISQCRVTKDGFNGGGLR